LAIKAGVGLYVLAILGLSLVLLVAHSLVTFLLLLAMRHLPGRKMKQLFIASSAVLGVLIVLVSQLASSQLARVEDPTEILEAMGKGQLERTWYLPSTWMVNAVLGLSPEYGLDPLPYGVALVGAALGFSSLAVGASGRWFLAGWSGRTEETGAGRKKKNGEAGSSSFASSRAPAGTYWTVLRKDLKLLFRDPLVWYNLVIGAITIGFFIFNQKTQASMRGPGSIMDQTMMSSLVTFISVLMGAVAGAQTGGISLSREGSSFWLLGGNPVSAGGLFAAKYTYALMPPAVLFGLSLAATSALGLLPGPLYMPILLGLSMVVAVASAQILLDVYFPDFSMKVEFGSSQKGKGSGKLLTTMLGSMAMLFALFFILILPTTNLPRRMFPTAGVEQVAAVTQALVICLGALMGVSAVVLGSRRMKRILTDM